MSIANGERLSAVARSGLIGSGSEERFDRLTRIAAYVQDTAMATLSVIDGEYEHFKSCFGIHMSRLRLAQSLSAQVLTEGDFVLVPDATRVSALAEHPMVDGAPYIRFFAGYPIRNPSNQIIGALSVLDHRPHRTVDKLRQGLSDLAAIVEGEIYLPGGDAKARTRLVEEMEQLKLRAFTDSLTGIWNRGAIMDFLGREIARCQRSFSSLAVVMIDFDHFKSVNDEYGHMAGDAVLRQGGARLRKLVRTYDGIGRYGGEEFMAVLVDSPIDMARQLGERICEQIAATPFHLADGSLLKITASLGVAVGPISPGTTPESIVNLADQALYRAKYAGRNRTELVVLEPPLLSLVNAAASGRSGV